MFKHPTTIVVGAGASCEIGLPSGEQLKGQILALLKTNQNNAYGFESAIMAEAVKRRLGPNAWDHQNIIDPLTRAAHLIRRGLPVALSIDNFLHTHQGDIWVEQLGKAAIAASILSAERESALFKRQTASLRLQTSSANPIGPSLQNDKLHISWYIPFVQLLFSQVSRQDASNIFDEVKFIIFNYDRCLEQFLWLALQSYFDMTEDEASTAISGATFLHPYGSLGPLPWQKSVTDEAVSLGSIENIDIWSVGSRIRTFTESVMSEMGSNIKRSISNTHTIIFLGFGYLDQNVELLSPPPPRLAQRVLSTAYGVSKVDQEVMEQVMRRFGAQFTEPYIDAGTCRDLFEHHRLRLSLT